MKISVSMQTVDDGQTRQTGGWMDRQASRRTEIKRVMFPHSPMYLNTSSLADSTVWGGVEPCWTNCITGGKH